MQLYRDGSHLFYSQEGTITNQGSCKFISFEKLIYTYYFKWLQINKI